MELDLLSRNFDHCKDQWKNMTTVVIADYLTSKTPYQMIPTFQEAPLGKRLAIFLPVATLISVIALFLSIKIAYPGGSVPQLDGYCCGYCENGTECAQAATNDQYQTKDEACAHKHEKFEGRVIKVPIAPVDTWTNIAYLVIALLPFALRVRASATSITFAVIAFTLGIGSGLFHAGGTAWGRIADMFGIFLVFGFLVANAILIWQKKKSLIILLLLTAVFFGLQYWLREIHGDTLALGTIAIIILIPLFLSSRTKSMKIKIFGSILIFILADVFRSLDGWWCCETLRENSILQFHGLWHVTSAIGIGYVYWVEQCITEAKTTH